MPFAGGGEDGVELGEDVVGLAVFEVAFVAVGPGEGFFTVASPVGVFRVGFVVEHVVGPDVFEALGVLDGDFESGGGCSEEALSIEFVFAFRRLRRIIGDDEDGLLGEFAGADEMVEGLGLHVDVVEHARVFRVPILVIGVAESDGGTDDGPFFETGGAKEIALGVVFGEGHIEGFGSGRRLILGGESESEGEECKADEEKSDYGSTHSRGLEMSVLGKYR